MISYVKIYEAPPEKRRFFYGFFSLFGKAPVCGTGEQGSIPGDTQYKILWLNWIERWFTTPKVEGSSPSEITKNVNYEIKNWHTKRADY